jgi:hypothetical protein
MDIGFSLSVDNNPHGGGDDIPMGTLDLNIQPPLQPGQTRSFTFNTPFVQNNSIQTNQNFFACVDLGAPPCGMICETCEVNNCSSTNVRIGKPDVAIPDITYPSPKISGEQVPITVSIQNFGCDSVCNNTTACIGMGPGSNCVTKPFCIDPFDIKQVTIDVQAPLSEFDCGSVDYFNISACHSVPDANVTNNCRNETIGITEQFWDLDLSIVGGDNSAGLGDSVDYTVRVTNNGNMPSPNCLAFITGINCSPGPGQWGCVLDSVPFKQIGTVQPGQTKSFNIGLDIAQCCVPPIKIGQQWLKAEILYTQGEACDDDCGEGSGNNLHQEPIQITF